MGRMWDYGCSWPHMALDAWLEAEAAETLQPRGQCGAIQGCSGWAADGLKKR